MGGTEIWKAGDQIHLSLTGLPQLMTQIYEHSQQAKLALKPKKSKNLLKLPQKCNTFAQPPPCRRHDNSYCESAKDHDWSIQK